MGTRRQFSREFKLEAVKAGKGTRRVGGTGRTRPRCARERVAQVGARGCARSAAGVSWSGRDEARTG